MSDDTSASADAYYGGDDQTDEVDLSFLDEAS